MSRIENGQLYWDTVGDTAGWSLSWVRADGQPEFCQVDGEEDATLAELAPVVARIFAGDEGRIKVIRDEYTGPIGWIDCDGNFGR